MEVPNLRVCLFSPRLPLSPGMMAVVLPTTMMRLLLFRGRWEYKAAAWAEGRTGLLWRQLVVVGLVIPGQVVRCHVPVCSPSPDHLGVHRSNDQAGSIWATPEAALVSMLTQ